MFLLFINVILKEYTNKKYKHLNIFFGIILLILNTIFLYFSIITNIHKNKNIYKYSINIFDITDINNNYNFTGKDKENEFYKLLIEFYQWFYNSQIKNILTIINKKFINNKINIIDSNLIQNYIKENNKIIIINKKKEKNINESKIKKQNNIQNNIQNYNNNSKEIILNDNKIDILNNKTIKYQKINIQKENENENYIKKESQEDLAIHREESNNSNNLNLKATNNIDSINNLNHNDYINININPRTSKNININIHFSSDKNSIIDHSSSKEMLFSSKRVNKYGKTALIPKKLTMTNIISEANSFKRKRRLIKSIKIKEYNLHLKGTGLPANIAEDEEVDFSDFEKNDSKTSKDKKTLISKNNFDFKYNNFRGKKSYKEIDLNISNSDPDINDEMHMNSNIGNTLKHHLTDKHVHFAPPGNN